MEVKRCIACGELIAKQAKICKVCHKRQNRIFGAFSMLSKHGASIGLLLSGIIYAITNIDEIRYHVMPYDSFEIKNLRQDFSYTIINKSKGDIFIDYIEYHMPNKESSNILNIAEYVKGNSIRHKKNDHQDLENKFREASKKESWNRSYIISEEFDSYRIKKSYDYFSMIYRYDITGNFVCYYYIIHSKSDSFYMDRIKGEEDKRLQQKFIGEIHYFSLSLNKWKTKKIELAALYDERKSKDCRSK
ncbi:hypothetical protein [Oceanospirillum sediminis]|uniref:Uncharacterized protein n=1 Tax=Oceanospirillum sediminis TaxID=2760088 RepID=A0A839IUP8_9GAMM|nr:hypothetical protein [Oceanospirillum sediminis]MBB1489075.1 hypothetical protein [Oceanospirillum sediminis]